MEAQPLQGKSLLALANPSPSIQAYEGAVRSGKTFTSLIDWLDFIRHGPAGALAMIGRTERTVINNLILPLQEMLGRSRVQVNYGTGKATILSRDILIYGANNEASRTKIQGATLAGAYVDEASTIPESFFTMLYTRLSIPGAKLWFTANPEGPAHWLKTDWLDRARLWIDGHGAFHWNNDPQALDLHRFTFLLDDNKTLPAEYVARTKKSYSGLFYRRYIGAEWVVADGAVFDDWNPEAHIIAWDNLPMMQRILAVGIDYGTTNASSAIILGLGTDNRLYALDEWRWDSKKDRRALKDSEIADRIMAWLQGDHTPERSMPPEWTIVDPAAASFKVELASTGVTNVINGNNEVLYGIRTMASLLTQGNLIISDRCTGLLAEIPGYSWDTKATEKGEDKPVKVADHSIDALRYAVATTETNWRPYIDSSPLAA